MNSFDEYINNQQIQWRKKHISVSSYGIQNNKTREWILPLKFWEEGLWQEIRKDSENSLPDYLSKSEVHKHDGSHNLKSSWILCANLYFSFRKNPDLLANFLKHNISTDIASIEKMELEFAEDFPLDPKTLLGEPKDGTRGKNQTSPDIAFIVRTTNNKKGLILTENKFTEHSFYDCSGRKAEDNHNSEKCSDIYQILNNLPTACFQLNWENAHRPNRKYWNYLKISKYGQSVLKHCPAAFCGCQLFRQQALAEGIAASGKYDFVFSCVAYDERNSSLISSMKKNGVKDFRTEWGKLFDGKTRFATFSHQQWASWVRAKDNNGIWKEWLAYVKERYEL